MFKLVPDYKMNHPTLKLKDDELKKKR